MTQPESGIMNNVSPLSPPSAAPTLEVVNDFLYLVVCSVRLDEVAEQVQELVTHQVSCVAKHRIIPECLPKSIENLSLKNTPKSDHKSETELNLEQSENRLRTVQLALEILTGVCATLPDPVSGISTDENDEEDPDGADIPIPIRRLNNSFRRGRGDG